MRSGGGKVNDPSNTPELTRVHRLDSLRLDETYFTGEGYLIDTPIVTSVGIFEYKNPDGSTRRELRLPEHVFAPESLASYEGKPVIITHNANRIDKRNVEHETVGTMLSKGYRDGDDVRCKIIIHAMNAVKRSGLRELSLGYDLELDKTPGIWEGQPYDAVQTGILINHLALVGDARAGDQARLNIDGESRKSLRGGKAMSAKTKSKALTGEELKKTVEAYNARRQRRLDEGEQPEKNEDSSAPLVSEPMTGDTDPAPPVMSLEEKLQTVKDRRDRRDQDGNPTTPDAAMGTIAQQDEDIGALMEIIEELQAKSDYTDCSTGPIGDGAPDEPEGNESTKLIKADSADAVDTIIRERIKLGRLGDQLNLDGLEEMKPLDAKKAIIVKVNPGMRLDGKSSVYVNAAFDAAVAQLNTAPPKDTNYQRRQMSGRMDGTTLTPQTVKSDAQVARERMIEKMMNGGNE
jgi:hypothetical protein